MNNKFNVGERVVFNPKLPLAGVEIFDNIQYGNVYIIDTTDGYDNICLKGKGYWHDSAYFIPYEIPDSEIESLDE